MEDARCEFCFCQQCARVVLASRSHRYLPISWKASLSGMFTFSEPTTPKTFKAIIVMTPQMTRNLHAREKEDSGLPHPAPQVLLSW